MSIGSFSSRLIVFCLFIFVVKVTFAQGSGSIKGKVYDNTTNEELPGANVILKGTQIGAASDLDGDFVLRNVPAGKQTLSVTYVGYVAASIDVEVKAGVTLNQDIRLDVTTIKGQEIVITAQAQGQQSAIQQQLSSDKISNVVSEQRIQLLPDFNAAQTISRLPGVSTTQSSGEDNKVVIRGLSPKFNSIEIEGIRMSSTGSSSIGLTSNNDIQTGGVNNDRSVDLTSISPYMIRMIAVYKSLTPDMNANSIGGTVNMELREAPSGLHWDLKYNQGYTAKSETYGNYRAVGSISTRFFDDDLGVYFLLNAESYDRNSDNLDAAYDIKEGTGGTGVDPITGYRPVEVNTVTLNRHLEARKRYGGNLILDYKIPNGSLKFINMVSRINSDYTDNRQIINYDQGRLNWRLQVGENVTDQQLHSLKLDYDLDFITADISASYTSAANKLEDSPYIDFFYSTTAFQAGVDRDNIPPEQLRYLLPTFSFQDSNLVLGSANLLSNHYKEEKYSYKADFEIPLTLGSDLSGYFKFGGQYSNQTNTTDQETPYVGFGGGSAITNDIKDQLEANFGLSRNTKGYFNGSWFRNNDQDLFNSFLDNQYGNVLYASNPSMLVDIINYIKSKPELNASLRAGDPGNLGGWYDGPYQQLVNDYKYKEKYYSSYTMARFNFFDFMVIGGVRYEKMKTEYFAYNAKDARNARQQVMYDTTAFEGNEFLLPMAQMKYTPFEWMDIRYAYTQTIARPDYNLVSPKFTVVDLSRQIFAGNPQLKPAHAFNHDVNLTFHSNGIGLISVGGFYKNIENFVYNASYQLDAAQNAGVDNISRYIIVRNGVKVVEPAGANYTVFRPLNNPNDAIVKGLELDFQHSFWYLPVPFNNIVFGINYTRIYSKTEYPWYDVRLVAVPPRGTRAELIDSSTSGRLIDQPNHVLNSYIGYDYEGFSSRLSILFQDNNFTSSAGRNTELDSYSKEYFRIDFSARQKLPWYNTELFLDVQNMNNANTKSIQRSFEGFRNIQNYGLVVNLGVRVTY